MQPPATHNAFGIFKKSLCFLIAFLLWSAVTWAQPTEYLLKAGFLEKFARFTNWPPQSHMDVPDAPFVISVIGKSPFKGSLEKIYHTAKIKNKPVKIQYIKTAEQIPGCHILFICESEKKNLKHILAVAGRYPILIVSDTRGFGEKGTHINLYITPNGTLRFEINLEASKNAGLSIQLVLLEIAKIIGN